MNGLKLQFPRIKFVIVLNHEGSGTICKIKVPPMSNGGTVNACHPGSL